MRLGMVSALAALALITGGCGESDRDRDRDRDREERSDRDRDRDGEEGRDDERAERRAIERVLEQDSKTGSQESMNDTVSRMRAIDLDETPREFADAYRDHIRAWEEAARVQDVIDNYNTGSLDRARAFLQQSTGGASAGMTADQLATALTQAQNRGNERIRSSFQDVLRIARNRDARIPPGAGESGNSAANSSSSGNSSGLPFGLGNSM